MHTTIIVHPKHLLQEPVNAKYY